jgi:hypothetical protein
MTTTHGYINGTLTTGILERSPRPKFNETLYHVVWRATMRCLMQRCET